MSDMSDAGYVIYHRDESGSPEDHEGGPFFYRPQDYAGGEVWSRGYPTWFAALRAARAEISELEWERQQNEW